MKREPLFLSPKICHLLFLLLLSWTWKGSVLLAQEYPEELKDEYRKDLIHYVDHRDDVEKVFNWLGKSKDDVGRSFAFLVGVSHYPNFSSNRNLKPVDEDLRKLLHFLKEKELFDEIVVLKNEDFNLDKLKYFLQTYFPKRFKKYPNSRFLFAFSGHGTTENLKSRNPMGYLLTSKAKNENDIEESISMMTVRLWLNRVINRGHHVLALVNSCYSGAFLRESFGPKILELSEHKGAHAITAGGSGELSWHDPKFGTGSVFFEAVLQEWRGRRIFILKRVSRGKVMEW